MYYLPRTSAIQVKLKSSPFLTPIVIDRVRILEACIVVVVDVEVVVVVAVVVVVGDVVTDDVGGVLCLHPSTLRTTKALY